MVPNISSEIVLQLKNLKPGNCVAFGSAFKVPTSLYIDKPDPEPLSNDVDLEDVWFNDQQSTSSDGFVNPMMPGASMDVADIMKQQASVSAEQPVLADSQVGGNRFIQSFANDNQASVPQQAVQPAVQQVAPPAAQQAVQPAASAPAAQPGMGIPQQVPMLENE